MSLTRTCTQWLGPSWHPKAKAINGAFDLLGAQAYKEATENVWLLPTHPSYIYEDAWSWETTRVALPDDDYLLVVGKPHLVEGIVMLPLSCGGYIDSNCVGSVTEIVSAALGSVKAEIIEIGKKGPKI
jgi:hypothetical protein